MTSDNNNNNEGFLKTDKSSTPGEVSRAYSLFYGFFMLPAMIAAGAFIIFYFFFFITEEDKSSPSSLLFSVDNGSQSNQWQSAVYLTKLIMEDDNGLAYFEAYAEKPEQFLLFKKELSRIYKESEDMLGKCDEDSWKKRYYIANMMGRLRDPLFVQDLLDGSNDLFCISEENNVNKYSSKIMAISSLGQINYVNPVDKLDVVEKLQKILLEIDNGNRNDYNQILEIHIITTLGEIGFADNSENFLKSIIKDDTWKNLKNRNEIISQNLKWNASLSLLKIQNNKFDMLDDAIILLDNENQDMNDLIKRIESDMLLNDLLKVKQLLKDKAEIDVVENIEDAINELNEKISTNKDAINEYKQGKIILIQNVDIVDEISELLNIEYYNDYRDVFDIPGEEDHTILNVLGVLQHSNHMYINNFKIELEKLLYHDNVEIKIISRDILSKIPKKL